MTLLYYDPIFLTHDTGQHPECAERLVRVTRHLYEAGLDMKCEKRSWKPASQERLARVHTTGYVERMLAMAAAGGGRIETDTTLSRHSGGAALQAAGAVCDAVEQVLSGNDRQALCLVRPPGHHAVRSDAMGFCLLNNIAIAARVAQAEFELDRLLVVDFDVHHGNGTQDAFWRDGRVGFLSIHRWPFYPGTGARDETGSGDGLGTTVNLPVEFGTSRDDYRQRFAMALDRLAAKMQPDLILLSAGFDAHRLDPVGSLGLETEDFSHLTSDVLDIAESHCGGRIVSVLEGGYNVDLLGPCVAGHLEEMLRRSR